MTPAAGTLVVSFDGLTRGRSLDIAVPSRWKSWQVTNAGSPALVSTRFDPARGLLHVYLDDAREHHSVTVQFSS